MKLGNKKYIRWALLLLMAVFLMLSSALYLLKDKLIDRAIVELNKNLEVPMSVDRVELAFWSSFPNISVDLLGVKIPGRQGRSVLLTSDKFNLRFNPLDLLGGDYNLKQINITEGTLNLEIDTLGRENFDIIKDGQEGNDSDFRLALRAVRLKQMNVRYLNMATKQDYSTRVELISLSGELSENEFEMLTQGNVQVLDALSDGILLIKNQRLEFDLSLSVDKTKGVTKIPTAEIDIGGLPFEIDGYIHPDSLWFNVKSNEIELTDAVEKLALRGSKETLNKFKGKGLLDFELEIFGGTSSADPVNISCLFAIKNGQLREPIEDIQLRKINLKGHYFKIDENPEELVLENISLISETGPFKGSLSIVDFSAPKWNGSAKGKINLNSLNRIFGLSGIDEVKGFVNLSADFLASESETEPEMILQKCDGTVNFENVTLKLSEDKRRFEEINGKVAFTKQSLKVNNFSLAVNKTDMSFKGSMFNIFNYLYNDGDLGVKLNLSGSNIALTDLGSTSKEQKKAKKKTFVLPENIKGSLSVDIQNLNYEKHDFRNVQGVLAIEGRNLDFRYISLENSGSRIEGGLNILESQPESFELSINANSSGIRIQEAFREWDNFYQDVLLVENIEGVAALNISFRGLFDLQTGLEYPTIDSKMELDISNGVIRKAAIMNDIAQSIKDSPAKYVFGKKNLKVLKKRLKNISFERLKNTITIRNSVVSIPKMLISSSILDMNISGTHNFDNDIDYKFDFKFRDLKQSNKDSEFGEIIDDGTGFRMFLKMYGPLENPTLEWDREQQKKSTQEYRQETKKQLKEMLKTEFGAFKKDTALEEYVPEEKPKEDIKINWEPTKNDPVSSDSLLQNPKSSKEVKPNKKQSKLKKALEKLKEQQKKEAEAAEEKIGIKGGG